MTDKLDLDTLLYVIGDESVDINDLFMFIKNPKGESAPLLIKKLNIHDAIVIKLKGVNNIYRVDHFRKNIEKKEFAYREIFIK